MMGALKNIKYSRNGKQVGTSVATTYKDTGLTGDTTYSYQVKAVGNNGLISTLSVELSAKTSASGS